MDGVQGVESFQKTKTANGTSIFDLRRPKAAGDWVLTVGCWVEAGVDGCEWKRRGGCKGTGEGREPMTPYDWLPR